MIQADCGNRCQTLSCQRGETAPDDHIKIVPLDFDIADVNLDITALGTSVQEQTETDKLTDDCSPTGTGNTQVKNEDQQRIQRNVQDCAADDTNHGIAGTALKTELIVEYQRCSHPWCAEEDDTKICFRIGKNRGRRTQQVCQRLQEGLSDDTNQQAGSQGGIEACGGHIGCFLIVLLTQFAGNVIAAALTEEEADSLNDGHHGEYNTDSTGGGIAFQHTNEIGISHIIKCCDQHTDDAGNGQSADQVADRRLCHSFVFQFHFIHGIT